VNSERDQQMGIPKLCISVFFTWFAVSVLYAVRIPMGYKSFWAEDGSIFYQDAAEETFLETLKFPTSGYLILIGRIGGKVTSNFPLENVTFVNFILATFVAALSVVTVFNHSRTLVAKIPLRIIASIGFVFIPVANFDSIANLANLHFFLPFVVLIVLISSQKNVKASLLSVLLIILACLSDPLCIFCFPALLYLKKSGTRFTFSMKDTIYAKTYLASMFIQLAFTVAYLSQGARSFGQEHSVVKTFYLFLDRVVGSTFIPGWGRVSSSDFTGEFLTAKLLSRAVLASTILIFWVVLYLKLIKKEMVVVDKRNLANKDFLLFQLLACSLTYWFVAGIAFNPEPRYGIFPSFCLLMCAIVIVDRYSATQNNLKARRFTLWIFIASISATWIFSWAPSPHRITGPEWREELGRAIKLCTNSNVKSTKLQILPEEGNWFVEVPCSSLLRD
jgi:hypothetical protein